jgi:hypothetical protein
MTGGRVAVRSYHHPPVLILAAGIVDEKPFRVVEKENPAQHILSAPVPDEFRVAPRIPHCDTEMVVSPADIIGNPRLGPGKHKNPRFAVAADFIFNKCGP